MCRECFNSQCRSGYSAHDVCFLWQISSCKGMNIKGNKKNLMTRKVLRNMYLDALIAHWEVNENKWQLIWIWDVINYLVVVFIVLFCKLNINQYPGKTEWFHVHTPKLQPFLYMPDTPVILIYLVITTFQEKWIELYNVTF